MIIGNKNFSGYTYIMAIINLTPDSFYAPSRTSADEVLFRVERAIKDGAAVIDLGAQSTRPGYGEIPPDKEISRLEKPLYEIKKNFDIPVSVDTYSEKTARFSLELGADMINDIWGLSKDGNMAETIARFNASVCIMHNAEKPVQGDIWAGVLPFLRRQATLAVSSGIAKDKIILDGGVGFAKNISQNFEIAENSDKIQALGYPALVGVSRKSMFGGRVEDRLSGTLKITEICAKKRILFVRVHDIAQNAEVIKRVYEEG